MQGAWPGAPQAAMDAWPVHHRNWDIWIEVSILRRRRRTCTQMCR